MLPRVKRPIHIKLLAGIYYALITPILIIYTILIFIFTLLHTVITLPWSYHRRSSNWTLDPRDREMGRTYAEQIQAENAIINRMFIYLKYNEEAKPPAIRLYPHKSDSFFGISPGKIASAELTYPRISEVFARLEGCGWRREDIYDLFASLTNDSAARTDIKQIKERACRGNLIATFPKLGYVYQLLLGWTLAPLNMWKTNRNVVDVDMESVNWILGEGHILRPKDLKTLKALDSLNSFLGMWKFVTKEDDLRVDGYWQYVVAYDDPHPGPTRS